MDYREGQLGSFPKKYVWTCKAGQSKRQAAMQTVNKLDSLSSHLMNQTTARIRHKWSMNLRMDWECLSVFKKPDRSPAGHCSLSWFLLCVLRQGADVSLLYTGLIQISQRTAANTEPPQSACFYPRHVICTVRAPTCTNAARSQRKKNMLKMFV